MNSLTRSLIQQGIRLFPKRLARVISFHNLYPPMPADVLAVPPGHVAYCIRVVTPVYSFILTELQDNQVPITYQAHSSRFFYIFGYISNDMI